MFFTYILNCIYLANLICACFSGATVQEVLRSNSLEATEENLPELKYDQDSVWGYAEVC